MARTAKNAFTIDDLLQESKYLSTVAPYQIPENWCWTSLGRLCELGKGAFLDNMNLPYWDAKSLRGMKEPDIIDSGIVVNAGEKVILVDGENSGEVFSIFEQGYMGSTFRTLHFSKVVNEKYATFIIDFHRDQLRKSKIGSAIPHLNKELFFQLSFPLPPLAEQQRIVDRIESLFAKLNEAKEKVQAVIDGYEDRKAAILHKAFTGELTSEWRKNQCISFNSWGSTVLNEVLDVRDGTHDSPKYYDVGFPLVTSKNLKNGIITDKNLRFISKEDYDKINERSKVDRGDILLAMIGTIGNPVVIEENPAFAIKNVALLKNISKVNPYFVKYYLENKKVITKMEREAKGSTQKFITLGYIRNFPLIMPTTAEQEEIVRIVDNLLEKEQCVKEVAEQTIEQIDSMKKSILVRAFRGELGTNDPTDEPAIELLKRAIKSL
ncbi:MAG: restriction endonuclease subunit S [Alphaproteobacteria bacterium]|nr:restriction endonuclease subunit S [Alphaproteobacteria bacterium]